MANAAMVIANSGNLSLLKKIMENASKKDINKIKAELSYPYNLKEEIRNFIFGHYSNYPTVP